MVGYGKVWQGWRITGNNRDSFEADQFDAERFDIPPLA
jgi:hypothetical protein